MFVESTIKLITGIFDFQNQELFSMFFLKKDPYLNAVEPQIFLFWLKMLFLSHVLIYTNLSLQGPNCVCSKSIKECPNFLDVRIYPGKKETTFPVFFLYLYVKNCSSALFYINREYTAERNLTPIISLYLSFYIFL